MKVRYLFVFCFFMHQCLLAQQLPLFTQYRENAGYINPASIPDVYLTYEQQFNTGISYRSQWTSLKSAPRTQTLHGEFLSDDFAPANLLVGGYLINDQTGPTGFTGLYARVGTLISGDPYYGGISVGFNVGAVQYRVNASELVVRDQGDILTQNDQAKIYPDVGVGVFGYTRLGTSDDVLFGGVSMPQTLGLDLQFKDEDGEFNLQRVRHYFGQVGLISFLRDDSYLQSSAWVKYVPNAPVNVDVNVRYHMSFNFWVGAGGSTAKSIHLETGVIIGENVNYDSNLRIGYGFDYYFSTFGPFTGVVHELNLAFSLNTD